MPEQKQSVLAFDWAFFFYWLMATTSGWLLGWLLLPAIALVIAGIGAGVMQCLVLIRRIPHVWRWILATVAGWLVGVSIALFVVPSGLGLLSGAVIGATTGIAQWGLLRFHVRWAGWWIVISVLAWATALSAAPASGTIALPPVVLSGVMAAVPTGLALDLLLRNPKVEERTRGA
ncbi:MAG: hypothetical protein JXM73_20350 [Anaerolineae bacterium]|nr:hypothetical protein [Anaerolineae bacterium]